LEFHYRRFVSQTSVIWATVAALALAAWRIRIFVAQVTPVRGGVTLGPVATARLATVLTQRSR